MPDAVMQAVEGLQTTFAEFRKANDERLDQIEKSGKADPLLEEKLSKINEEMDRLQGEITAAKRLPQAGGETKGQTQEQLAHQKAFGRFVRKGVDTDLRELEQKAMSVGSDPDGGYFVPSDLSGRMVQRVYETSPIRQVASVITISTDDIQGETDLDEAGAGWVSETGTRSETDTPQVGKWKISVHEEYAEPRITQKLLDDAAFDVEAWLNAKVADKFARQENAAFVTGNGVGRPFGFAAKTTAATADGTRAWGQLEHVKSGANGGFAAANPADYLLDLVYKLKVHFRSNASWMCPRTVLAAIRKLKDGTGMYIWTPGLEAGAPSKLLGYPVYEAEDIAALANDSLSLWFGDFRAGYLVVDRMGVRVLRDPYTAKPFVKFYTTKRCGGDVVDYEAIKALKFSA
jgi:HK97 family phage major capsid protein